MRSLSAAGLFAVTAAVLSAQPDRGAPLRLVQTIPLSGVEGRIDHMAVDAQGQRLFVAALGNNTLEVVDLKAGRAASHLAGLSEPQGVAFAPETNRLFVANGEGARCDRFDGTSLRLLGSARGMDDADNVRYDASARRIYVGYGRGAIAALDAGTGARLGEVRVTGHPESFQLEKSGPRLFVNVPSAAQIAVIDRTRNAVVARWPASGAAANFPMALDEPDHRLFVGCRRPPRMLVYDTGTGKGLASVEIGGDTDDLFYDGARRRIYVSCGAGVLDVIEQQDPDHYHPLSAVRTAPGARTSLFISALSRLCLAVPRRGSQPAEIRVFATGP
jgi:DNA-binding beta-propeller fold protein YncE